MRAAVVGLIVLALSATGCSGSSPNQPTPNPNPTPPSPTPPVEPEPTPQPPPPAPRVAKIKYLAFGDSLTEGTISLPFTNTLVTIPHAYPAVLSVLLHARYRDQPELAIANEGKAGEFANEGRTRFAQVIRNDPPEVVLLMEGANDINVLGRLGVTRAVVALEEMLKEARRRNVTVLIATLPPQRIGGRNAEGAPYVEDLNAQIRKFAAEQGATLVDVNRQLDLAFVGQDGLHLTEAGYVRLAEIFAAAIRQTFETAPSS